MAKNGATGKHGNVKAGLGTGLKVPDAIKKARGTYHKRNADLAARKVGAEDASELMLPVDVPAELWEPPETLHNPAARAEWQLFIKPLIAADVIKLSDLRIAQMYCDMWATYEDYMYMMNEAKKKGEYLPYPQKLAMDLSKLMREMGLTPVSRHKVVRIMKDKGRIKADEWGKILDHDS